MIELYEFYITFAALMGLFVWAMTIYKAEHKLNGLFRGYIAGLLCCLWPLFLLDGLFTCCRQLVDTAAAVDYRDET